MKPCPHCKTTIKHGTRFGCCSGCGWLFSSQSAFDLHHRVQKSTGRSACGDVESDPRFVVEEKKSEGRFIRLPQGDSPWSTGRTSTDSTETA